VDAAYAEEERQKQNFGLFHIYIQNLYGLIFKFIAIRHTLFLSFWIKMKKNSINRKSILSDWFQALLLKDIRNIEKLIN